MLSRRPQLAEHCDWSKFDGGDWSVLLCKQPQFADRCDWTKLDDEAWRRLRDYAPEVADRRPPEVGCPDKKKDLSPE